ncbi:hypothetical protein [Actinomycetospora aeridis]|uniref:Uncharacterized protein n=1 Tax=Actinomycetospora aeridis TaxID=3129231 RepID=A0ABU8N665_9PSEU
MPLESLPDLPGFAHAVLAEAAGARPHVLAEIGTDEGTADAVLAWGRRAGAVAADRDLALDDVIVTTDRAHHLLRALPGADGVWVYLRVHRDGGNLALARRRLTALTATAGPAAHPTPAANPGPARPAELPAGPSSTETSRGPSPEPSAAPPPARRSNPWPVRVPSTTRSPAASSMPPPTSGPATPVGTAALAPAALPAPAPAPNRPDTPNRPDRPSRAAPVSAPAAAPVFRTSPPRSAAPPTPPPTPPPTLPAPRRPAPADTLPAGPAPPADEDAAPPPDSAGVLGQRWRTDPETLRRVLAGLLRLGRTPHPALAGSPETTTRSPGATPTRRNP